jgi:hypothetical protein
MYVRTKFQEDWFWHTGNNKNNNNNSIQFKFISVQNLTAQWPITKLARVYIDTEK